ncbi:hypothetical protein DMH17_06130 [Raoultella planticola]|nr:hypothetical protein [Raoultella planticola]
MAEKKTVSVSTGARTSIRRRWPTSDHSCITPARIRWVRLAIRVKRLWCRKGDKQRRLHKAPLRYHDPANWPLIRQALESMGRSI